MLADPGPWRRMRYALGFRLPPENHDWVRRDLMGARWRGRMLRRHLVVIATPIGAALALLPGAWWIRALAAGMVLVTSALLVLISAAELRVMRLRRHGWEPGQPSGARADRYAAGR